MARVVIVSNRVPVPTERGARAGGLAVGIADALKDGGLWFGWSGQISANARNPVRKIEVEKITYATIDLNQEDYDRFYVGYANSTLWPLLHFRLGLIDFKRQFALKLVKGSVALLIGVAGLVDVENAPFGVHA